jgi:hypothetical protein
MGAISFSNVIFDQPIRRRRRLARLAIPVGVALWAAAIGWILVRIAT